MKFAYPSCTLILVTISLFLVFLSALPSNIQEWTDDNLAKVDEMSPEINRIYLFYADWCGACNRYKPKFLEAAGKIFKIDPNLQIIKINLDKAPKLGSRFRISHLPSVYHQIGEEFRKVDVFQGNLETFVEKKAWIGTSAMGPLSPVKGRNEPSRRGNPGSVTIQKYVDDLGISMSVFIIFTSSILLFITLFIIWCIWLYTDYKLNSHRFTDEAIKERIKFLRKQPEFKDEFASEEDEEEKDSSGNESDSESESYSKSEPEPKSEPESDSESKAESKPKTSIRGRRTTIKNRFK